MNFANITIIAFQSFAIFDRCVFAGWTGITPCVICAFVSAAHYSNNLFLFSANTNSFLCSISSNLYDFSLSIPSDDPSNLGV